MNETPDQMPAGLSSTQPGEPKPNRECPSSIESQFDETWAQQRNKESFGIKLAVPSGRLSPNDSQKNALTWFSPSDRLNGSATLQKQIATGKQTVTGEQPASS